MVDIKKDTVWCLSHSISLHLASILLAVRSKAWVCDRSFAGIVGSKPAGGMDVDLYVTALCFQVEFYARDRSRVQRIPNVVCVSVISKSQQWGGLGQQVLSNREDKYPVIYWRINALLLFLSLSLSFFPCYWFSQIIIWKGVILHYKWHSKRFGPFSICFVMQSFSKNS